MRAEPYFPVLSFFTGGGFLDIGFESAGFDVVWTNEYNPDIADMYESGMTSLKRYKDPLAAPVKISSRKSIVDLDADEVLKGAFKQSPPEFFGVIGGPSCPDFSVGGKNRGHEGDHGKLSQTFIDMICALKPNFFLMENVPGLVKNKKHRAFLDQLRKKLLDNGFVTDLQILNALDYGVPQERQRVFIVGFRNSLYKAIYATDDLPREDGWFEYPTPTYPDAKKLPWPSRSTFGMTPSLPNLIPDELTVFPLLYSRPPPSELPNGKETFRPYSDKFNTVEEGDDSKKSFKRLHRYRYSPTACYGNNEVHLHPSEPRRLTVREALRIQKVPDEYVLPVSKPLSIKFKMIANGVPCLLGQAMAEALMAVLSRPRTKRRFRV